MREELLEQKAGELEGAQELLDTARQDLAAREAELRDRDAELERRNSELAQVSLTIRLLISIPLYQ